MKIQKGENLKIYEWQYNLADEHGLTLTALFIYALIYRENAERSRGFTADIDYLRAWTQTNEQTALYTLQELKQKGLIRGSRQAGYYVTGLKDGGTDGGPDPARP